MESKKYEISISTVPSYLPAESDPENDRYAFSYTIIIRNVGQNTAQLISRHWIITDGADRIQEVKGLGVVGRQPLLEPGEVFEYTSACVLPTPIGNMRGTYRMVTEEGTPFDLPIPEFMLAMPRMLH